MTCLMNHIATRVVLLALLLASLGHAFIIEQPGSAKLGDMPRFRQMCDEILYVA